ncbi:MAG: hypothetical protein GC129_01560 [Proteobacteria bacterium]|nr:hypothetical protein [Pseudomonadota bacterium]
MQAMLFLAIFSLFLSVTGGIIVGAGESTAQLSRMRVDAAQDYMNAVRKVAQNITLDNFELAPSSQTDILAFIRTTPDLAQLGTGRWADPTLDPWGQPMQGLMVRENRVLYSNPPSDTVVVPVTGVALISSGPNHKLETTIPAVGSISALQGILPPVGSDDIVITFTNEDAQRDNWANVRQHLGRIASAQLRYYQEQVNAYRTTIMNQYLTQLQSGSANLTLDFTTLMANDPNAPRFLDLSVDANRRLLGVDEDFRLLEKTLPGGGKLAITSIANPDSSLTLRLTNNATSPTPWGSPASSLSYSINLKGTL